MLKLLAAGTAAAAPAALTFRGMTRFKGLTEIRLTVAAMTIIAVFRGSYIVIARILSPQPGMT